MMMYHQTKFGCKRRSSSKDTESQILIQHESSLSHCDLGVEDSAQLFQLMKGDMHYHTKFGNIPSAQTPGDTNTVIPIRIPQLCY